MDEDSRAQCINIFECSAVYGDSMQIYFCEVPCAVLSGDVHVLSVLTRIGGYWSPDVKIIKMYMSMYMSLIHL